MAGPELIDRDLGMSALKQQLKALEGAGKVYVGVTEKTAERENPGDSTVTNADVGLWMEFGVPSKNIPERSWLRSAFDNHLEEWYRLFGKLAGEIVDRTLAPREALRMVGRLAARDVRKGILDGIPPPNAASTVERKGHEHTLIDTHQLVDAIDFEVGPKDR